MEDAKDVEIECNLNALCCSCAGSSPNITPASSDSERNSDNNFEEIPTTEEVIDQQITSLEEFDKNLPETVSLIRGENGTKVYLVGTAHFSEESQNDVARVIQMVQPNVVMVELCSSRTNILHRDAESLLEEAKNINMEKILNTVKQNGVFNGLMYVLLLNMSAHLTKELGMAPGGEFRRAFTEARKVKNCDVQLGDRPIQITVQRALAKLSWFKTIKFCWHLITAKDPIRKEDIEKCKRRDILEELLAEMTGEFPALSEVFVHERDIYLTHSLQLSAQPRLDSTGSMIYPKVVGVVGMGHVPGITHLWPESQTPHIRKILEIPPPSITSRIIRFTFKLSVLSLGGYLVYKYIPVSRKLPVLCNTLYKNILDKAKFS